MVLFVLFLRSSVLLSAFVSVLRQNRVKVLAYDRVGVILLTCQNKLTLYRGCILGQKHFGDINFLSVQMSLNFFF